METSLKQIQNDLETALKNQDKLKVSVLRMLLSDIHNLEIQKKRGATAEDIRTTLMKQAKQHGDSIVQFEKGGGSDLAAKERAELKILKAYLPQALSEKELSDLVREAVSETAATGPSDFGKVMKVLMPKVKGRSSGQEVSQAVNQALEKIQT